MKCRVIVVHRKIIMEVEIDTMMIMDHDEDEDITTIVDTTIIIGLIDTGLALKRTMVLKRERGGNQYVIVFFLYYACITGLAHVNAIDVDLEVCLLAQEAAPHINVTGNVSSIPFYCIAIINSGL